MYDFDKIYHAASVEEAVCMLQKDENSMIISGGTDVLIKLREGRLTGCSLVSIHDIEELKSIYMEEDGTIVIGPAVPFSQVTNHPIIRQYLPFLGEAADTAGGPQIRNMGTIGGNICNGATSADTASTLKALDAQLVLVGSGGERRLPIHDFYTGPGKTVRGRDEVMTQIRIARKDYENMYGQYIKYGKRNAMEIATLGCAVLVRTDETKTRVEDIRIAYGVAAPTPIRCFRTEETLKGRQIDETLFAILRRDVLEEVSPRSSWRASKTFRIQLIKELGERALGQALAKAGVTDIREGGAKDA